MKCYTIIQPDNLERNLMNNMVVVKQMINLYLGQGHQDFTELQQAVIKGDFASIQSKAHHIKPTMAYIGAAVLTEKFERLERLATDGESLEAVKKLFDDIQTDFNQAMCELKDYRQSLT